VCGCRCIMCTNDVCVPIIIYLCRASSTAAAAAADDEALFTANLNIFRPLLILYTRAPLVYLILYIVCVCVYTHNNIIIRTDATTRPSSFVSAEGILFSSINTHTLAPVVLAPLAGRHSYARRATKADAARRLFYHNILLCIQVGGIGPWRSSQVLLTCPAPTSWYYHCTVNSHLINTSFFYGLNYFFFFMINAVVIFIF